MENLVCAHGTCLISSFQDVEITTLDGGILVIAAMVLNLAVQEERVVLKVVVVDGKRGAAIGHASKCDRLRWMLA